MNLHRVVALPTVANTGGRGVYGFGELPDRITLYKNNMQEHSADLDALRSRVHLTLVHEIGHYFGGR